jgi:hypothetical protein
MPEYTKSQIGELLESGLHYHRDSNNSCQNYVQGDGEGRGRNVRRRISRFVRRNVATTGQTMGEIRLRKFIRKLYEGYAYKSGQVLRPEKFQLEMLHMVVPTLAKNIVGPEWESIGTRICREFGWKIKRQPKLFLGQVCCILSADCSIPIALSHRNLSRRPGGSGRPSSSP